jgi:hypothetical protein
MKLFNAKAFNFFLLSGVVGIAAAPAAFSAEVTSTGAQAGVNVKQVVAAHLSSPTSSGFKWEQTATRSISVSGQAKSTNTSDKWASVESTAGSVLARRDSASSSSVQGFRWGIRSTADQQGFRWGIRSTADQQGFRWGIRSTADQQGFRWGIRSAADQQGFRWGIRSTADQQGFRWGIRSTADQQGFRWGIRSVAEQQGFRWDIR